MTGVMARVRLGWKESVQTVVGAQCKQGAGVLSGSAFVSLCSSFGLHSFGMLKWDMKMGPASGAIRAPTAEKLLQNLL